MPAPPSLPIESITTDYLRVFGCLLASIQVQMLLQQLLGPTYSNMAWIEWPSSCFSSVVMPWGWRLKLIGFTYMAVVEFSFLQPGMYWNIDAHGPPSLKPFGSWMAFVVAFAIAFAMAFAMAFGMAFGKALHLLASVEFRFSFMGRRVELQFCSLYHYYRCFTYWLMPHGSGCTYCRFFWIRNWDFGISCKSSRRHAQTISWFLN